MFDEGIFPDKPQNILIVEDDRRIAEEITGLLEDKGIKTFIAETGKSALQFAEKSIPDVVIMDISLKGPEDGIQTAEIMRAKFTIPIIYYSGSSDEETIKRAKITLPHGYLVKPSNDETLLATIEIAYYKFRIQQKLREKEKWFTTVVNNIGEAIITTGKTGEINYMNKVAEQLTGWKLGEVNGSYIIPVFNISLNNADLFSKDPFRQILNGTVNIISSDKALITVKEGKNINVSFSISPVIYEQNIEGMAIVFKDISNNIKKENLLREKESNYRAVIDSSSDAICVMQNNLFVMVNNAWEKLFGYSSDEALSKDFDIMSIIAPGDKSFIETTITRFDDKDNLYTKYEMHGFSKTGQLLDLELRLSEITWEGNRALQGIYRDIKEKHRAEGLFRFLSSAVEQSPASVVITDMTGAIKYVNPMFSRQTGYALKEIVGLTPNEIGWGEMSSEEYKRLWKSVSYGGDWRGEFKNKRRNGEIYWDIASISAIRNERGEITHLMTVSEEITERKINEEKLIRAKETAEKSDKLKTEFIAHISHEISTPLNNILSSINLFKEELEEQLSDDLKNSIKIINNNSKRLIRTIRLLMNLSKISSNNYDAIFEKIDLDMDIFGELAFEYHLKARKKNLAFTFKNTCAKSLIVGDRFTIREIFINLLDNAIKFTNKGEISVNITDTDEGRICVEIADTGIGISDDFKPNIFLPFSQEDTTQTREYQGTGLGLTLVQKYAELNGADINIESSKGKGSKFSIIFK